MNGKMRNIIRGHATKCSSRLRKEFGEMLSE
jgi:hypothetical protein